jgi:hypothetical protein
MPASRDLLGRWDIVSWEQAYDDGHTVLPMGDSLSGFIHYTPAGDMACLISRNDRPRFTSGGQWDATDSEQAQAYRSMLAYGGRFDFDGEHVVHHVEQSLYPGWVGGQQRRRVEFAADGSIVLTARLEEGTPHARTARLVWRRHEAGPATATTP